MEMNENNVEAARNDAVEADHGRRAQSERIRQLEAERDSLRDRLAKAEAELDKECNRIYTRVKTLERMLAKVNAERDQLRAVVEAVPVVDIEAAAHGVMAGWPSNSDRYKSAVAAIAWLSALPAAKAEQEKPHE